MASSSAAAAAAAASDSQGGLKARDVCIVGVARTPIGALLGSLSSLPATKLGSIAIQGALRRANVDPALVQEVFMGNVLSANLGQAPARQAALGACLPNTVPCTTVNKVCSSGMKAVMFAAQSIQLGINDVVVAGGMESMSNAPKYVAEARRGSRFGHDVLVDGMLKDGLWDVYNDFPMGMCAELCADQHSISREEQDSYAILSNERGIAAQDNGAFSWEITPVEISSGRGKPPVVVDKDESLAKFDPVKLKKLGPTFKANGSVTAGNSSSISDGAAAIVLVSGEKAKNLGLQVIARIRGYADAAQAPELFTTAPALSIPKAISSAGLQTSQIDYYEINEAFAVVALANQRLLDIPSPLHICVGKAWRLKFPSPDPAQCGKPTALGCTKKREAAELHAFPETHANTAQYFHQFCFTYSGCALPYLLLRDSRWPYPSCLCDCQGWNCFERPEIVERPIRSEVDCGVVPDRACFSDANIAGQERDAKQSTSRHGC